MSNTVEIRVLHRHAAKFESANPLMCDKESTKCVYGYVL